MRIRTIQKAIEEIKREDPESQICYNAIRNMVRNQKIPAMYAGNKALIDLDLLIAMLEGGETKP